MVEPHIVDLQEEHSLVEVGTVPADHLEEGTDLLGSVTERHVSIFLITSQSSDIPGNQRSRIQFLAVVTGDTVELVFVHTGVVGDSSHMMVEGVEEVCCKLAELDCMAVAGRIQEAGCTEAADSFAAGTAVSATN